MVAAIVKICSKCNRSKSIDDFYADKRKPDGLKSHCKRCHNQGSRKWQLENRSKDLANKRSYMKRVRLADPNLYQSQWRDYYYAHLSQERGRSRQWAKNNPEKRAANSIRYATRKRGVMQGSPKEVTDYRIILASDPCCYCGARQEVIDHIIPIALNGENDWTNLTSSCNRCNASKGAKSLLSWMI